MDETQGAILPLVALGVLLKVNVDVWGNHSDHYAEHGTFDSRENTIKKSRGKH